MRREIPFTGMPVGAKSNRSLRILEVTPRYFPFIGGVENHVYQVSRRLAQAGVDVTVLTTEPGKQWEKIETMEGVKIERVQAWPPNRDYYFAPQIWDKIQRGNWDLIHIQSYHTFVPPLAMMAALSAKIPYIITFHGGGHSSKLRNAIRGIQRALLRPLFIRAKRLIAVAQFEIDLYGKRLHIPEEKFCLIPNGADLPQISQNVSSQQTPGTLIASIGRLEQYKGHQRVISAMPKLIELIPDIRLWIAGIGPYESILRDLARNLGVEDRVEIRAIPSNDKEAMAKELSKAALVILLSEFETHPIAVLEALSLGRPVLVADTSGLSEIAAKGWARAIPLNSSPNEIAIAAAEQIANPVKQVNIKLPTWDDCSTRLLTLYKSLVEEPA